jgi:hypothetical protein
MRKADEIDYRLIGDDLQAVIVTLDPGEAVTAEAGAMMYMEDGIRPITTLDPNNEGGGLLGKLMGGAKRVLSGDSFMMTVFINESNQRRDVAFASPFPGKIQAVNVLDWGGTRAVSMSASRCSGRSEPASSAAKGSCCRRSAAMGSRSCTPAARWCSGISSRVRSSGLTPAASWRCSRASSTKSRW